jgi:DNA-binding MarR family transcriptional regulator
VSDARRPTPSAAPLGAGAGRVPVSTLEGLDPSPAEAGSSVRTEELAPVRLGMTRLQRLFASRRIHSNMAAAAGVRLSEQGLQVLRTLGDGRSRPVGDLARAARMDAGAVSRQLKALEDAALVRRESSPAHGSIVLVEATPEGRRLARRYERVRSAQLARALEGWTPDERLELGRLLVRLVDDLQSTPYLDPDELDDADEHAGP